jgi:hypothetical protein
MNPSQILDKYRSVVVANSDRIVHELSHEFRKKPEPVQKQSFGGSYKTGFTWLIRSESQHTDKVVETVVSAKGDAITSLYVGNHPAFATLGTLMAARAELIEAVATRVGLSQEAVGVEDPGRGRQLGLSELSTGQLIDLLAERMGSSIVVPNSRGGEVVSV